jgi:hypothetical protein
MTEQPSKIECRKVKPLQRARCENCRQWMGKAERVAGMKLCAECYTSIHGYPRIEYKIQTPLLWQPRKRGD